MWDSSKVLPCPLLDDKSSSLDPDIVVVAAKSTFLGECGFLRVAFGFYGFLRISY